MHAAGGEGGGCDRVTRESFDFPRDNTDATDRQGHFWGVFEVEKALPVFHVLCLLVSLFILFLCILYFALGRHRCVGRIAN